jgi:SET domain-containing protein
MPGVVVRDSGIEGKGVFAARDFRKGETVLDWRNAKALSRAEFEQLPEGEKRYVAFFGGKIVLQDSPAKYVNHSCEPNTFVRGFCDIALRGIKKGEEITSDYSNSIEPGTEMKCSCGSSKCRGIIRGRENG